MRCFLVVMTMCCSNPLAQTIAVRYRLSAQRMMVTVMPMAIISFRVASFSRYPNG